MIKEYNLDQLYPQKQSQPEDGLVGNFGTHQHPHQDGAHCQPSARPLLHRQQQEDQSAAHSRPRHQVLHQGLKGVLPLH